jgi:hypothetical protein
MLAVIAEQWCAPEARQQAGSGVVVAAASAAGARNPPSISSNKTMAVNPRMDGRHYSPKSVAGIAAGILSPTDRY